MIKPVRSYLTLVCLTLWWSIPVVAQSAKSDSAQLGEVMANVVANYNKAIGEQSRLYNGPAFVPYNFKVPTNANFNDTTEYDIGTINYDYVVYKNVPLIYDLNRDVVISKLANGYAPFVLLSVRLSWFNLFNHHFVKLPADSLNKNITLGFYDELYNNKLKIYARRTKSIQEESTSQGIKNIFVSKTEYYIKKDKIYYTANSQRKVLDVLKDKKTELKQYLKDNKIRYKDNQERGMVLLAAYYDRLRLAN